MTEETILVVTEDTVQGTRGWGDVGQRLTRATEIPISVLEQNMSRFLLVVGRLFQQADQQVEAQSNLQLDEVHLQVEISGKGEIKLFAGGEASGKGVITLKFNRKDLDSKGLGGKDLDSKKI